MRTKLTALIAAIFLFTAFSAFAQKDLYHLKYGTETQQRLDLFLPKDITKKTPVIIMLHGGAWSMGGNEYTDKHARDMRNRGFVVANVDYRYINDTLHATDLLKDIDNAVNWVEKHAKEYGYNAKGYNLVGVSAGAHLSLLYGYTTERDIKSITAFCAPSNFDSPEIMEFIKSKGLLETVEKLAGTTYSPENTEAFKAVSPYWKVTNVPTQLIHGDADDLVDYSQSVALYAKLRQQNVPANLITQKGKGHDVGMNSPDSEQVNLEAIDLWIKKWK